jgi:hypothetical protein
MGASISVARGSAKGEWRAKPYSPGKRCCFVANKREAIQPSAGEEMILERLAKGLWLCDASKPSTQRDGKPIHALQPKAGFADYACVCLD